MIYEFDETERSIAGLEKQQQPTENRLTENEWNQMRKNIVESTVPTEILLTYLRDADLDYDKETISVINI